MGVLLKNAGVIMARRLDERRLTWSDLDDMQMLDLFHAAFLEAAPEAYPHRDAAGLEEATNTMFAVAAMELVATTDGPDTIN